MATTTAKDWASEPDAYHRVGTRKKMNTDWPIENKVSRTGPRTWTVFHLLCDGSWDYIRRFSSRAAAYADAGIQSPPDGE